MMTVEEKKAQYARIEREADALGRIIGVRLLRLSQQMAIDELMPNARNDLPMLAAAACEIDSIPLPFPRTRKELDHAIDLLDAEGMRAATAAWRRLNGINDPPKKDTDASGDEAEADVEESELDRAKK